MQGITYDLHAPAGTTIVSVISLGPREVLHFYADNGPTTYDTLTRVVASTPHGAVTATTSVVAPLQLLSAIQSTAPATPGLLHLTGTASATGIANQGLPVHLSL